MVHQLLWIEILLKGTVGLLLILAPRLLARGLGLPPADQPFWPRVLGAVLIGIAVAAFLEVKLKGANGLGLAGAVAVNLAGTAIIGSLLILGQVGCPRRGRVLLWLTVLGLMALSLAEIAWA